MYRPESHSESVTVLSAYRPEWHSESATVRNAYRPESRSESGLQRDRPSLGSMPGLRWGLVTEPNVYRRESRS